MLLNEGGTYSYNFNVSFGTGPLIGSWALIRSNTVCNICQRAQDEFIPNIYSYLYMLEGFIV